MADENGTIFSALFSIGSVKYCCNASIVALSHGRARTQSESSFAILFLSSDCWSASCSFAARFWSFARINCATSISGTVMVPVLSTHSTFTRASVSIHFMSWISTFCFPSLITDTTIATLARRYRPSGIIPRIAATMPVTLSFIVAPEKKYCCKNRIAPIGKMITPTVCTRRFNARIISDCSPSFVCVACNISPEI